MPYGSKAPKMAKGAAYKEKKRKALKSMVKSPKSKGY